MKTVGMKSIVKLGIGCICIFNFSTLFSQDIEKGLRSLELEQKQKAKSILLNFAKQNPTNALALYYAGEISFVFEKYDSASYYYSKGLEVDKANPYNYIGAGKIFLQNGNKEEARKNFDKAFSLAKGRKDPNIYLQLAEANYTTKNKDIEQATIYLDKVKEFDKTIPETYIKYGDIFLEQNNAGKALTNYERATEVNKTFTKGFYKIGMISSMARMYQEALNAFQAVISIDSNYIPVYRELGELYFMAQKYDKASESYSKYIEKTEEYTMDERVRYAYMLFFDKKYDKAKVEMNVVLKKDSNNVTLLRLQGYSSFETKDYKKGLYYMDRFFKLVDKKKILSSDYEYNAKLLKETGSDSIAIINYKEAMILDSTRTDFYKDIAEIYNKKKDYKRAAENYELLIKNTATPLTSQYFSLGKAYYFATFDSKIDSLTKRSFLVFADSAFSKVNVAKPDYAQAHFYRAGVRTQLDPESTAGLARPQYEMVIKLYEGAPEKNKAALIEAYQYLGYYFYLQKDNATSKSYWEKLLVLDPNDKQAKDALKGIK